MTNIAQTYHDLKRKKASLQHCIKAIAGEVVNRRSVHLINFCSGGQVIALKTATALILDRCSALKILPMKNAILIFTLLINLNGCTKNNGKESTDKIDIWYRTLKKEILTNSEKTIDSIDYQIDKELLYLTHYNKAKKIFQECRSLDTSRLFGVTKYGQNTNFELRNEVYENGTLATEGLLYIDSYYGPWIIYNKNGSIMYQGYRYKHDDFGNWIYYWEDEKLDSIINRNNLYYVDSILKNTELRTTKVKK